MGSHSGRYLALLRGINNAGRGTRVAMADLRALFEGLGFRDVRTLLNSGNIIFVAPTGTRGEIHARIVRTLASELQVASPVFVLSADQVAAAVRGNPLSKVASNPSHLLVVVPRVASDLGRLRLLLKKRWAPEALALGSRVAYLWCAKGVARSPLWAAVERALERSGTARNIATFTKAKTLLEGLDNRPGG